MATRYGVRELSYAFVVEWVVGDEREVAVVLIQDEQLRLFWCYRCDTDNCDHTRRVVHHLIDLEGQ